MHYAKPKDKIGVWTCPLLDQLIEKADQYESEVITLDCFFDFIEGVEELLEESFQRFSQIRVEASHLSNLASVLTPIQRGYYQCQKAFDELWDAEEDGALWQGLDLLATGIESLMAGRRRNTDKLETPNFGGAFL